MSIIRLISGDFSGPSLIARQTTGPDRRGAANPGGPTDCSRVPEDREQSGPDSRMYSSRDVPRSTLAVGHALWTPSNKTNGSHRESRRYTNQPVYLGPSRRCHGFGPFRAQTFFRTATCPGHDLLEPIVDIARDTNVKPTRRFQIHLTCRRQLPASVFG